MHLSAPDTASPLNGIIYDAGYLVRGVVIFHMVGKTQHPQGKTHFMALGNYILNGLLGLSAPGLSVFFIACTPFGAIRGQTT